GLTWTDTIAAGATVSAVTLQFNDGVDCNGAVTYGTTFNGTAGPTWVGASDCLCTPSLKARSVTLSAAGYRVGLSNTFLTTTGYGSCLGFSPGGTLPATAY